MSINQLLDSSRKYCARLGHGGIFLIAINQDASRRARKVENVNGSQSVSANGAINYGDALDMRYIV